MEMNMIHRQSIIVVDHTAKLVRKDIRLLEECILELNGFAIMQFVEGADLWFSNDPKVSSKEVQLLISLMRMLKPIPDMAVKLNLVVNYQQLTILRKWLETRMTHCEKQREESNDAFNPDTYIGQKLMLIDIRELMLGEILD